MNFKRWALTLGLQTSGVLWNCRLPAGQNLYNLSEAYPHTPANSRFTLHMNILFLEATRSFFFSPWYLILKLFLVMSLCSFWLLEAAPNDLFEWMCWSSWILPSAVEWLASRPGSHAVPSLQSLLPVAGDAQKCRLFVVGLSRDSCCRLRFWIRFCTSLVSPTCNT